MSKPHTYQVGPGRAILRDGRTIANVSRVESAVSPSEADEFTHEVVDALNGFRIYQVLSTKNSPSGNPQRITMVYNGRTGEVLAALDHGYIGDQIPRGAIQLPGLNISRSEYHAALRCFRGVTAEYAAVKARNT